MNFILCVIIQLCPKRENWNVFFICSFEKLVGQLLKINQFQYLEKWSSNGWKRSVEYKYDYFPSSPKKTIFDFSVISKTDVSVWVLIFLSWRNLSCHTLIIIIILMRMKNKCYHVMKRVIIFVLTKTIIDILQNTYATLTTFGWDGKNAYLRNIWMIWFKLSFDLLGTTTFLHLLSLTSEHYV